MVRRADLLLPEFEGRTGIPVMHRQMEWAGAWNDILQIAVYQKGPDVSELGNTWLAHVDDMHVLRPFDRAELEALGGKRAFTPSTRVEPHFAKGEISIPWTLDTRLVYYRRDVLAQAGVDEQNAFGTTQAMLDTLRRLQSSGIAYPLAISTANIVIHNLSSWIWDGGGDFRSADGHRVTLLEPEAREGMIRFFKLHRYIHPAGRMQAAPVNEQLFYQGQVPVLFTGQWSLGIMRYRPEQVLPEVIENAGLALPPGKSAYLGGSHLVIWQHSLYEAEAMALVRHLAGAEMMTNLIQLGFLPARLDVLNAPPFSTDPDYGLLVECVRRGRPISPGRRWAALEVRINEFVLKLFSDLFSNPEIDVAREVDYRLRSLSEKVERTILSSW